MPYRNAQALSAFLAVRGHRECESVGVAVSHEAMAYSAATSKRADRVRHALDRFHLTRWFRPELVAIRRGIPCRPECSKLCFDKAMISGQCPALGSVLEEKQLQYLTLGELLERPSPTN